MPVGVPKILLLAPGDEDPSWTELYNGLYRERTLFLGQQLTREIGNTLMGLLAILSINDPTREFFLFINSPGGSVRAGIGVCDMMETVIPDVHTICIGTSVSMASFILAGGEINKRLAFPHARVMLHQPASSYYEDPSDQFVSESGEMLKLRETVISTYIRRTGQPYWVIAADIERDGFMSAREAQVYGIVDFVGIEEFEANLS